MPHIDTFKWLISRLRRLRMNVMKARWHMLEQVGWEMARVFNQLLEVEVWRMKRRARPTR